MATHWFDETRSFRKKEASNIVTKPNNEELIDAYTGFSSLPELITKPWAIASRNAIRANILHSDMSGIMGCFRHFAIRIKAINAEIRFGSNSVY